MITSRRPTFMQAARRHRKGIGFLWFCIVTIPVLFFSAGLSVDFTRIIVAAREASNLADASAVAGASQFQPGKPYLNVAAARKVAEDTWKFGSGQGSGYQTAPMVELTKGAKVPKITFGGPNLSAPTEIKVTVTYEVKNLMFVRFFSGKGEQIYTRTATAFVCNPSVDTPSEGGYTYGYCVKPEFRG